MEKDLERKCKSSYHTSHSGNAVYGLGFVGAVIYFIMQANSFWLGVLGVLKAIVWPAILVFEALRALGA